MMQALDYEKPLPCTNRNESIGTMILHLGEENGEVCEAYMRWKRARDHDAEPDVVFEACDALAEELTDVVTMATTILNKLGLDSKKRAAMQVKVNVKNEERGYF